MYIMTRYAKCTLPAGALGKYFVSRYTFEMLIWTLPVSNALFKPRNKPQE